MSLYSRVYTFPAQTDRAALRYSLSFLEILTVFILGVWVVAVLVNRFGFGISALSTLPVMHIAWRQGRWIGLFGGALFAAALFRVVNLLDGDSSDFIASGFGPGFYGLSLLGFLVGQARDRMIASRRAAQVAELARDALKLIAGDSPITETLDQFTQRIEQDLPGASCSILTFDANKEILNHASAPNLPAFYCEAIDGVEIGPDVGSCGTAAFRNDIVIVKDTQSDPLWIDFAELAKKAKLRACWSVPIRDANNKVLGTFATYYNIPRLPQDWELKLVNEAADLISIAITRFRDREHKAILEEQVRVGQKLEGLGLLAGGIAHDFNNLLMGVLGNAEILMMELEEGDNHDRARGIVNSAEKAADLAKQMLVYAGKGSQQITKIALSMLVSELVSLARAAIPKNIQLELVLADDLPTLSADSTQLQQLFMNLVSNAAEAIGDGGGKITIRTDYKYYDNEIVQRAMFGKDLEPGKYLSLQIIDTGPGIPEEQRSTIFDPFYSTKSTGHGLGLAVVLGTVKNLNGAIILDSQIAEGSSFTILLPSLGYGKLENPKEIKPSPVALPINSGVALVIDDEPSVRRVATAYLRKLGFAEILEASDGGEGIKIFRERAAELSLVLVDLSMPDINGWQVLDEISYLDSPTRFILMTGYDPDTVLQERGTRDFPVLNKPFELSSLSNLLSLA